MVPNSAAQREIRPSSSPVRTPIATVVQTESTGSSPDRTPIATVEQTESSSYYGVVRGALAETKRQRRATAGEELAVVALRGRP
jgi:hypothetical protein